jgi:hypothetical protein
LPRSFVLLIDPKIPVSPTLDITCPRPEAAIPIGPIQRSMLKRNATSFEIDHLNGIKITHWAYKGKFMLIINRDSEMGCKFLRTICGSRTGGWSLPCVMSD